MSANYFNRSRDAANDDDYHDTHDGRQKIICWACLRIILPDSVASEASTALWICESCRPKVEEVKAAHTEFWQAIDQADHYTLQMFRHLRLPQVDNNEHRLIIDRRMQMRRQYLLNITT